MFARRYVFLDSPMFSFNRIFSDVRMSVCFPRFADVFRDTFAHRRYVFLDSPMCFVINLRIVGMFSLIRGMLSVIRRCFSLANDVFYCPAVFLLILACFPLYFLLCTAYFQLCTAYFSLLTGIFLSASDVFGARTGKSMVPTQESIAKLPKTRLYKEIQNKKHTRHLEKYGAIKTYR